jgi:integrase
MKEATMATVHFPKPNRLRPTDELDVIPYIMDRNDRYVEGYNHYLNDRYLGRIDPADVLTPNVEPCPLDEKTIRFIAFQLCCGVTFLETEEAHPSLGSLTWQESRRWIFRDLYARAMRKGYWTRSFWLTGSTSKLSYSSTIKPKVTELIRCGIWMQHQGYIDDFEAGQWEGRTSKLIAEAEESYRIIASQYPKDLRVSPRVRQNPGDVLPPNIDEINEFISELSNPTYQLAALELFETGIRSFELLQSCRIPPSWFGGPNRPRGDGEIGYLPDANIVWSKDPQITIQCRWKVRGKYGKIRYVFIPQKLLQAFWRYVMGERAQILRRTKSCKTRATDELFVNRDGVALSYANLCQEIAKANDRLGRSERITAHLLRHAYACNFLEIGVVEQLTLSNIDPGIATYQQFMTAGESVLVALQANLGHEFYETTLTYLKQLAQGKIAFRYQLAFNRYLDRLVDIAAS